jgi:hypothetical protein
MTDSGIEADEISNRAKQLALISSCTDKITHGVVDHWEIASLVEEGLERAHSLNPRFFDQVEDDLLANAVARLFSKAGIVLFGAGYTENGKKLLESAILVGCNWVSHSEMALYLQKTLRFIAYKFSSDELDSALEIKNACAVLISTYGSGHWSQTLFDALPSHAPRGKSIVLLAAFLVSRYRAQVPSRSSSDISTYLSFLDEYLSYFHSLFADSSIHQYRQLCISEFDFIALNIPIPETEEQVGSMFAIAKLFEKGVKLDNGMDVALIIKPHFWAALSIGSRHYPNFTAEVLHATLGYIDLLRDAGHEERDVVAWIDAGICAACSYANPNKFWSYQRYSPTLKTISTFTFDCMRSGALLVYLRLELHHVVPISSELLAKILCTANSYLGSKCSDGFDIWVRDKGVSIARNCRIHHSEAHIIWLAALERLRRMGMIESAAYSVGKDAVIDQATLEFLPLSVFGSDRILPTYAEVQWSPSGQQVFGDILSRTADLSCVNNGQDSAAPDELFLSCLMLSSTAQIRSGPDFPASRLRRCLDAWKN